MTYDISLPPEPRFCATCGSAVRSQLVAEEDRDRLVCQACGLIHYLNPRLVANAIPERNDESGNLRLLLMRRAIEPRLGYWSPPGGFVELGESTEEGALREGEEEVGMPMAIIGLLGVYNRPDAGIVVVAYRARALREEPKIGPEALEARWFAPEDIPWDDLAFVTTTSALRDWVATISSKK